jgi:hypothetical protein
VQKVSDILDAVSRLEAPDPPAVTCRGLRKVYGTAASVVALDRFDGEVLSSPTNQ